MPPDRTSLDALIAWLDAGRREDRDAMLALLADGATWTGIRPEWVCATPGEIVDMWLERASALDDVEGVELTPGSRPVLHVRAPSLGGIDRRLRGGVHIGFEIDADGRIAGLRDGTRPQEVAPADPERSPAGVPEAPLRDGSAAGEGWFVVNVAQASWKTGTFGAYTVFDGEVKFEQVGVNIGVLDPGQPACWYHREADQEDFLVLKGEALLLIEGEERRLRAWDLVHCPPWTEHVFVGAGTGPCTILALGGRTRDGVVYPVSELALRHGAGVRRQTVEPREAYADVPPDVPAAFDPAWLPGS
jgi:uncharacterized cupin superfamily protein